MIGKWYRLFLKNGSDQLIVTLYTLFLYPSVHKQLIRTLFEAIIIVPLHSLSVYTERVDVGEHCASAFSARSIIIDAM